MSAALALVIALAAAPGQRVLSFDMPHGGCRLTIAVDGSAALWYAALPHGVHIAAATFEPAALRDVFIAKARPKDRRSELAPPIGSVRFGTDDAVQYFDDAALATSLLRRAWAHRLPAFSTRQDDAVIARACALGRQRAWRAEPLA